MVNDDALAIDGYDDSTTVGIRRDVCGTLGKVESKISGSSKSNLFDSGTAL